jgi:hypothetical protein
MINTATVEEIIHPNSKTETLNLVFFPPTPREVVKFFNFMQVHITLTGGDMGISFRETKYSLAKLMEKMGYDYEVYQPFIEEYEQKLLTQYHETKKQQ